AVVNPEPIVNLGNDTSFCTVGTPTLVLDAGNAGATYLWDDASTNQTRTISSTGLYYVDVTNAVGCTISDSIDVTAGQYPIVDLGPDTAICDESVLTLDAANAGATYLCDDASTPQQRNVTVAVQYFVTATTEGICEGSDTIEVFINPIPEVNIGADSTICEGATLVLDAGNPGLTYLWDD